METSHTFCEPPEGKIKWKKEARRRRIPCVSHSRVKFRGGRSNSNVTHTCCESPEGKIWCT